MALARDLQARGVAGSLARSVANAAVDNDQEFELARELVERKSGNMPDSTNSPAAAG